MLGKLPCSPVNGKGSHCYLTMSLLRVSVEFDVEHCGFVELAELRCVWVEPFFDYNRLRVDLVNDTSTTRDTRFGRASVGERNVVADGQVVDDHFRVSEGFSFLVCIHCNRRVEKESMGDCSIFSERLIVD